MSCYRPLRAERRSSKVGGLRFLQPKEYLKLDSPLADRRKLLLLPCGKCVGCRIDRGKLWTVRILHEAAMHDENSFLTLTYSDENLPYGDAPTLAPRDLQLFHKRVRKSVRDYRYFGAGEYGSDSGRPHYHVIAFGWRPEFTSQVTARTFQSAELDEKWALGNATVGDVTPASAAYVAQYAMKKMYGRREREMGRAHEFSHKSKGLGKKWLEKFGSDVRRGYVLMDGKKVRLPRYYREKYGDVDPEWYLLQKLQAREYREEVAFEDCTDERLQVRETVTQSRRSFFAGTREPNEVSNA